MNKPKNSIPQINSSKPKRGRPAGRKNNSIRADRREAARMVAQALLQEPAVSIPKLAALAWPESQQDEKARKAATERARRALNDLRRMPGLAGDLAGRVCHALALRATAEERARQEREQKKAEAEARRREREVREEETLTVKNLARRLARYPEIRVALQEVTEKMAGMDRLATNLAATPAEAGFSWHEGGKRHVSYVPHFTPGPGPSRIGGGKLLVSVGDFRKFMPAETAVVVMKQAKRAKMECSATTDLERAVNTEHSIQRSLACLAVIPVPFARKILAAARKVRRLEKKGQDATAAWSELRAAVAEALPWAGWAAPEAKVKYGIETSDERRERESWELEQARELAEKAGGTGIPVSPEREKDNDLDRSVAEATELSPVANLAGEKYLLNPNITTAAVFQAGLQ